MNDWKSIELGLLGKTITGKTPSSAFPEDFGGHYLFITPTDSLDCKHISKTERGLSKLGAARLKGKVLPPKSVIVSCIGSAMGKVVMNSKAAVTNQQLNSIIPHQEFDADFIYYALTNSYKALRNAASGSTALPILNKTDFDLLKIRIPEDKITQQKIAAVLSALDKKIEINHRINQELEDLAKLLYDYWFVQFDFPISAEQAAAMGDPKLEGKPYRQSGGKMTYNPTLKREIPDRWKHGTLESLGSIKGGSTPSTKVPDNFTTSGTPWITPKDLSENVGNRFITRGGTDVTLAGIKSASLKLLPAGTVLLSSRAPIGYLAIARDEVTTNQGFKSFVPDRGYSSDFIYFTLRHNMKKIEAYASGSTFKEVSGGTLKQISIPLPDKAIVKEFTSKAESLSKQQNNLEKQNQELAALRDWLLPMLMNGQISVD